MRIALTVAMSMMLTLSQTMFLNTHAEKTETTGNVYYVSAENRADSNDDTLEHPFKPYKSCKHNESGRYLLYQRRYL